VFGQLEQPGGPIGVFAPRFGVPVVVGNGSKQPVILESVRAILWAHFPVAQIGARFTLWKNAIGCAQTLVVASSDRPSAAERPSPLRLQPGHRALVQLNFRFLACTRRKAQEAVWLQRITAVYRLPNGNEVLQGDDASLPTLNRAMATRVGQVLRHEA
jgi:hypothetical protein